MKKSVMVFAGVRVLYFLGNIFRDEMSYYRRGEQMKNKFANVVDYY